MTAAGDLESAMDIVETCEPFDLILLDYCMPGMNGLEGLARALRDGKGAKVALMSGNASRGIAEKAIEMGASGFMPKTLPAKSLVNAVHFIAKGEKYAPIEFLTEAREDSRDNALAQKLTPRELQVLEKLCEGKANKEIARDLEIQEPTVKLHMKTLYRKIGASNRTHAAMIAKEAGLF